jgi:DNA-binding PadR family transcriptional regulator
MSLQHITLGFLKMFGPQTGYDLKGHIDQSTQNFWYCDFSQIYRAMQANEAAGWVIGQDAPEDKRKRRLYHLTPDGESEFLRWLGQPLEPPFLRRPHLAQLFFGAYLPRERVRQQLQALRAHYAETLAIYRGIETYLKRLQAENMPHSPFFLITVDEGLHLSQAAIAWCDASLARLDALPPETGEDASA